MGSSVSSNRSLTARVVSCCESFACLVLGLMLVSSLNAQEVTLAPEHKKLAELEGKWNFVLKSDGGESKGTSVYKVECGGLWLTSDFNTDFGGANSKVKGSTVTILPRRNSSACGSTR